MTIRRLFFVLFGLTEIVFATYALFSPRGTDVYGYAIEAIWHFPIFLHLMIAASVFFTICYWKRFCRKYLSLVSVFLTVQWLFIALGPIFTGFYTISFPLYFFMLFARLLMSITVELEGRLYEQYRT